MKKFISILMFIVLTISATGCGSSGSSSQTEMANVDGLTVLETVWAAYEDDEKFAAAGGDMNNYVMDAPGTFDLSDVESLDSMLGVPSALAEEIDNAASLMHMMNANTFTCGSYVLREGADMEQFAMTLKDNIMNRQWMCGFPDTLIVVSLSDRHVVAAFGNAEIMETFKTKLSTAYENAEILYEESLS